MAAKLVDLVKVSVVSASGTVVNLGPAVASFRGVEALIDGEEYSYSIQQGSRYEIGKGTYSAGAGTLTRGILFSSSGGAAIPLEPGAALTFTVLSDQLDGLEEAIRIAKEAAARAEQAAEQAEQGGGGGGGNKAEAAAIGIAPTDATMGAFGAGGVLPNNATAKAIFQAISDALLRRTLIIPLFTDISSSTIPASVERITTFGWGSLGSGAGEYVRSDLPNPVASPTITQDAGGNWWMIDRNQPLYAAQFGVIANGTSGNPTDASAQINAALAGGGNSPVRRIFSFGQNFNARAVPAVGGITIGAQTVIFARDQAFGGDGFSSKIFVNTTTNVARLMALNTDGNGNWTTPFPGVAGANFGNVYVDGRQAAANGKFPTVFEIGISARIHDTHMLGMAQGGRQISQYIDQVFIDRPVFVQEEDGSGRYFWELRTAGDGCSVFSSHQSLKFIAPGRYSDVPRGRNTQFRYKVGSEIPVQINGDSELFGCDGIETYGWHQEFGQFRNIGSSSVLRGHNFWTHGPNAPNLNVPPIFIGTIPGIGNISPGAVRIEDCGFIKQQGFHGGYNQQGDPDIFIEDPWYGDLIIERAFRKSRPVNVTPSMAMQAGCITNDPMFNRYAHIAAYRSQYTGGHLRLFDTLDTIPLPQGGLSRDFSRVSDLIALWEIGSGLFKYEIGYIYDEPRKIGQVTGNRVSLDMVQGQGGALLAFEYQGRAMVRFYRGSPGQPDGVYDKYVDVPVMVGFRACDTGNDIMGYPWKDRTPGPVDTWNPGSVDEYNIQPGDTRSGAPDGPAPNAYGRVTVWCRSDLAIPTKGEWHWGDMLLRRVSTPVLGRRLKGYYRISNGTGNVVGTDWLEIFETTGDATASSAELLTAGVPVNQAPNKKTGRMVFNTSVNKPYWAQGSAPTDPWLDATGAVGYTPV